MYFEPESNGFDFFGLVETGFPILFLIVSGVITLVFLTIIWSLMKRSKLKRTLREHARRLSEDPSERYTEDYIAFLRSLRSFPVERTDLEPLRVALGCEKLILQARAGESTKTALRNEYDRLGIRYGEQLADGRIERN